MPQKIKRIVLGVCGSVAAYKAGDIIRRLREKGCDVTVVMTAEARQFITPLTLAALSGNKVHEDMFDTDGWRMGHIELSRETDALVIAPATANIIAKIVHGFADDLLSALAMTVRAPVLLAPAMNDDMYASPAVQENCRTLKARGARFIEPVKGKLACGSVGIGHLADVEDIVKAVTAG